MFQGIVRNNKVHYPNSKSNTLNWQILKLPPREEISVITPQAVEEIKTELFALAAIMQSPHQQDEQFLSALAA